MKHLFVFFCLFFCICLQLIGEERAVVSVGIDRLFEEEFVSLIKGKKIGLITNHTGINQQFISTVDILKSQAESQNYTLKALFAPEHGINGSAFAFEAIEKSSDKDGLPIFSLYGETKYPTNQMLNNINVLIYDIQDIGSRSYTYITTMFYAMEAAAKQGITFIVLDRPNPINGIVVDGPLLEEKWRSQIGYINIPYCHGMTTGELARYFNGEYKIGCKLEVVPMKGWNRTMSFKHTGLLWIPTSPYIPESDTPFFYPTTGILGELQLVNIGVGYTLPFKVVGAPWIKAEHFAEKLNHQKFPGVHFKPFYFNPIYGRYAKEACQGVLILITDPLIFKPVSTQYLLIGILKSLYPEKFELAIESIKKKKETLCKLNGTEEIFKLITEEKHITWKLCGVHLKEREAFLKKRQGYLIKDYAFQ